MGYFTLKISLLKKITSRNIKYDKTAGQIKRNKKERITDSLLYRTTSPKV
jgi:hypothetical protein